MSERLPKTPQQKNPEAENVEEKTERAKVVLAPEGKETTVFNDKGIQVGFDIGNA
jgi:hypothetical protein